MESGQKSSPVPVSVLFEPTQECFQDFLALALQSRLVPIRGDLQTGLGQSSKEEGRGNPVIVPAELSLFAQAREQLQQQPHRIFCVDRAPFLPTQHSRRLLEND